MGNHPNKEKLLNIYNDYFVRNGIDSLIIKNADSILNSAKQAQINLKTGIEKIRELTDSNITNAKQSLIELFEITVDTLEFLEKGMTKEAFNISGMIDDKSEEFRSELEKIV